MMPNKFLAIILLHSLSINSAVGPVYGLNLDVYNDNEIALTDENTILWGYLHQFPFADYKVYELKDQGKFYLDDLNDAIKNNLRVGIMWEGHILDVLKKYIRGNTVVVDAGAHIGTHSIAMSHYVGENGEVWAFEPQRKMYRELVMNVMLNNRKNIKVRHYALGNETKVIEMCAMGCGNEGGTGMCLNGISVGDDNAYMRSLDSFNLTNVSLIKIDVEGAEDLVLEGARQTILNNKPVIVIEIAGGHVFETATPEVKKQILNTQKKLQDMNYTINRLDVWNYLALPS